MTGSADYIDADRFNNLSFAGMSEDKTAVGVHWIDSQNDTGYSAIADTLRVTAADLGPWDISLLSGNWTGDMKKFWLEFISPNPVPDSTDVRIGWVKLTE